MNYIEIFNKQYHIDNYNCCHFACELYKEINGVDIEDNLKSFFGSERKAIFSKLKVFKKLERPIEGCLILFHGLQSTPHVGIYHHGKMLHINENGVLWQNVEDAFVGFKNKGFYTL